MISREYSAGAFVYMKRGSEIIFLLLEQNNGEYDLPKGHIEKGESSEQAAIREIKEETGIDAVLDRFFYLSTEYFFFKGKRRIAKSVKFFLCEVHSERVSISEEHRGYAWCDYETAMKKLKYKNLKELLAAVTDYISRMQAMGKVNKEYAYLPKNADGWELSERLVPGEGRLDAKLMIIGQAPGANEDVQLRPFVGRSGQLLDSLLKKVGIDRKDAYITSVVQFFPPENRLPSRTEVAICRPFLKKQIEIIRPKYMITLGNLSSSTLLGAGEVEKNHGKLIEKGEMTCLVAFHPAAALRFKDNYGLMLSDFRKLRERMGEISPKPA